MLKIIKTNYFRVICVKITPTSYRGGDKLSMKIGETLKQLRKSNGITQSVVSKHLNVSVNTISSYENNTILPSLENFAKLMNLYNASADFVLGLNTNQDMLNNLTQEQEEFFKSILPKVKRIITCQETE